MKKKMSRAEVLILVVVVGFLGLFAIAKFQPALPAVENISLYSAQQIINDGKSEKVLRDGDRVYIFMPNGRLKRTRLEAEVSLEDQGIDVTKTQVERGSYTTGMGRLGSVAYALIPVVVIVAPPIFGIYFVFRTFKRKKKA